MSSKDAQSKVLLSDVFMLACRESNVPGTMEEVAEVLMQRKFSRVNAIGYS